MQVLPARATRWRLLRARAAQEDLPPPRLWGLEIITTLAQGLASRGTCSATVRHRYAPVLASLTKSLELKSATVGQELTLRTLGDVAVNGQVVIPRDSKILGRVTQVTAKGKDGLQSAMAVVIEKAVKKDGAEINLQAIIAAVAAPKDSSLPSDPTYGMMRSNEPKMVGVRPSGSSSSGELSASSKATSTAAVATAELKGRMDKPFLLDENSQGAIGYEGLSISWSLASPPPVTIFTTKNKNPLPAGNGRRFLVALDGQRMERLGGR